MDIFPEDFEPNFCAQIQQRRARIFTSIGKKAEGKFIGIFVGFIPGAIFLGSLLTTVSGSDSVFFFGGLAGSALGYAWGHFVDRGSFSRQHTQKMTAEEISQIGKVEADLLRREHLDLISKLISMRPLQDPTVEQNIRNAIRDISFSIARLPGQPAEELLLNAATFKEEASRLMAKATHESDPVVAVSFQRQSAARNQRAEAISRNSAPARRNQTLRHEMSEHIKALNTMLNAMALEDNDEGHSLAALAANIQQVAAEARSLTEAKKELAFALEEGQGGGNGATLEQPQLQRSGQQ